MSAIRMACFQTYFVDAMQSRSHVLHLSASFSAWRGFDQLLYVMLADTGALNGW